ncbi:hypothetical protein ABZ540_32220 [Nocardia xishanensis]
MTNANDAEAPAGGCLHICELPAVGQDVFTTIEALRQWGGST